MKLFKTSTLFILLGIVWLTAKGQTGVSYKNGFSIPEMQSLIDELTYENHKVVLEQKGFNTVLTKTNPGVFLYEKSDKTQLKIFSEEKKIKWLSFSADKLTYLKVSGELANNSFQKIQQIGRFSTYNKNHYILILDPAEYRFTISFSGSQTAIAKTTPAPAIPKPNTIPPIEVYYSAKEIADAMNAKMSSAQISRKTPSYEFEVFGKMDLDKRSIRFITKENVLYLQINIPRNRQCDYGLKEVKANWLGFTSYTGDHFYIPLQFVYECNDIKYEGLQIGFPLNTPVTRLGVEAWIKKNATFKLKE